MLGLQHENNTSRTNHTQTLVAAASALRAVVYTLGLFFSIVAFAEFYNKMSAIHEYIAPSMFLFSIALHPTIPYTRTYQNREQTYV